jgi:hypothetical protein
VIERGREEGSDFGHGRVLASISAGHECRLWSGFRESRTLVVNWGVD